MSTPSAILKNQAVNNTTRDWPMELSRITLWISGQVWIPLLPLLIGAITTKFALSLSTSGLLASTQILSGAIGAFALSKLLGRFDTRKMAVVALIVALCGNLVAALTDSLSVFFLSRVTGGLAEGCLLGLASGAAAVSGRTEHIFSTYKINLGLYAVLGLVVAPSLITQFGLLGGYGIIIVMNIVTLALALKAFPRQLEAAHNEQSELSNTDSGPSRLFSGAICAAIVVSIIGMMGLQSFIERIGVEIINLDSQMIGNILAAAAAVSILSPLLVMYLVKQGIGRALPFAIAAAFNISAVVLLGLNGTPLFYIIAVLALMPFMLFTQPYQVGLLAELDPTGRLAAAAPGFFGIGAAIGPPLAGLFSEHFGLLNITFLACGLTLIAYLVITFAAHRVDKQSI